jgi:eukaryotic-like serine/threonine-protein kinase
MFAEHSLLGRGCSKWYYPRRGGSLHPEVIAHYVVGEKLGQGGMGEVYRATDTKLGRAVAVKFLPDAMASDAAHMARFTREAQVLASLNHSNIASIYGVEDRALIMELVEGQTLAERIKTGPLPLDDALAIARQIADALEAAHAKGIVHRDLKPANIKITPGGVVKVLDFGLAKVAAAAATSIEDSPTMATTQAGFIMGTAGYMAPEQARGREVDKRADVWAFGVVLYEMLTGAQLFQGETTTDVMAAVVRQDPDLSKVPARVRPLLRRCLDKDPTRRLRDVGDAMLLLDLPAEGSIDAAPAGSLTALRLAIAGAVISLTALAVLAFVHFRETSPPPPATVRFPLDFGADLSPTGTMRFAISPDGRQVAYAAFGADGISRIWLRPLDALTPRVLPGSEIDRNSFALFWSPDSRSLAYWADRKLKRIDISGGTAQTIADAPTNVLGGSWSRDGIIVFGTTGGVMQVAAAGGTPALLTRTGDSAPDLLPTFLPDGRHFLYLRSGAAGTRNVHVGSLDAKPEEQDRTPLLKTDFAPSYAPGPDPDTGHLLFVRGDALVAQPFDTRQRQLRGEPTQVVDQIADNPGGLAYLSVSNTGTLVYFTLSDPGIQLTWYGRDGRPAGTAGEPGPYRTLKVSPDGTRVAILRIDEQSNNRDIWQMEVASGTATRFTFDAAADIQPVWSADGSRIAWISDRGGFTGFYSKRADGSGGEELLYKLDKGAGANLTDWTRDGRFLIYNSATDIWAAPVAEGTVENRKPVPLVQSEGVQLGAYVSPDMRWVAYMSNESGRQDLFVQPFAPGAGGAGQPSPVAGKWMVSNGTLGMARWRADSRELLFVGTDGGVMAVDVAPEPVFKGSPPKLLFQLPRAILTSTNTPGSMVDVTRDHQRFLLSMLSADVGSGLKVVLNWRSEVKTD